eukprot:1175626-Prorocentrum_minimum.AAC.2
MASENREYRVPGRARAVRKRSKGAPPLDGEFTVRRGGFTVRRGGFTVRRGGFTVRRGEFTVRRGGFTVRKPAMALAPHMPLPATIPSKGAAVLAVRAITAPPTTAALAVAA